jgi:valyl-tRNA synthetase
LLITADWPEASGGSAKAAHAFEDIMTLTSEIRFITASTGVTKPKLYHQDDEFIATHAALIQKLAGLSAIEAVADGSGLNLTQTTHRAWLDLDHDTINHFVRQLADKLEATKKSIAQLEGRLNNKAYVDKAPKKLVDETKQQLEDAKEVFEKQAAEYNRFSTK